MKRKEVEKIIKSKKDTLWIDYQDFMSKTEKIYKPVFGKFFDISEEPYMDETDKFKFMGVVKHTNRLEFLFYSIKHQVLYTKTITITDPMWLEYKKAENKILRKKKLKRINEGNR